MATLPKSRMGLRPMRSIIRTVAMHAAMLTPPERMLIRSASLSAKPADCHSTAP